MAYPYSEEDYARLLRKAAQETRAAMMFSEMLDDVRPKRTPTADRASHLLKVIQRAAEPLTVAEIADQSGAVALKPVKTALRYLVRGGQVHQSGVKPRLHGGSPVATYVVAGDSRG